MDQTPQQTQQLTNQDKDKILSTLVREFESIKKDLVYIKSDKILNELLALPKRRLKRGQGSIHLTELEIKESQEKCETAMACANYLRVNYETYKKWAIHFNLFKTNPWKKGSKKKYWDPNKGKYPLNKILNGEFPNYPVFRLKDLLIRSGIKNNECENCGFQEKRITDNKMPLILNFEDGNEKNHKLENIRVFCYNCTFLCGKGFINNGKVQFNDNYRIQESSRNVVTSF